MTWEQILQGIVIGEASLLGIFLIWLMIMFSIKELRKEGKK